MLVTRNEMKASIAGQRPPDSEHRDEVSLLVALVDMRVLEPDEVLNGRTNRFG